MEKHFSQIIKDASPLSHTRSLSLLVSVGDLQGPCEGLRMQKKESSHTYINVNVCVFLPHILPGQPGGLSPPAGPPWTFSSGGLHCVH